MKIHCSYDELVPIERLVPHKHNANKHPEKQITYLSKIMDHQGWRHPITVSKLSGFIVAGHGRLLAAQKLGWESCPVDYQDFDNEAQEYAHLIADNKIAEFAEHDDAFMIEGIKELGMDKNFDLDLLGLPDFDISGSAISLDDLMGGDGSDEYGRFADTKEAQEGTRAISLVFESEEYEHFKLTAEKVMKEKNIESLKDLFVWTVNQCSS